MLGLLSCALKRVIIELCQEKSSNHEKHGWNFYAKVVFLQPLLISFLHIAAILTEFSQRPEQFPHYSDKEQIIIQVKQRRNAK